MGVEAKGGGCVGGGEGEGEGEYMENEGRSCSFDPELITPVYYTVYF